MTTRQLNPFDVTKAVDFSDKEINDYWVDLPGGPGFRDMAKPASPMPMIILGGKGSGKTHLMRYFSYPLQKLRHSGNVVEGLQSEGYVGVYLRCGGLNAARFAGKGQEAEKWATVFTYYMDLWLAQLALQTVLDVAGHSNVQVDSPGLARALADLVDAPGHDLPDTISGVLNTLREWQRTADAAVNNAAISRTLEINIRSSPGRLVFGVPQAIVTHVPALRGVQFLYLIDELENLTEPQQRYVNTLIREKQLPCSFKIGARLYGVRTFETYSAGERNRPGSEYELLKLDDHLRANKNYPAFARQLCARRLISAGYMLGEDNATEAATHLDRLFEEPRRDPFARDETLPLVTRHAGKERPYFTALRGNLLAALRSRTVPELQTEDDVDRVVELLRAPEYPLLEKTNLFLLYAQWSGRKNLRTAAESIAADCRASIEAGRPVGEHAVKLKKFKTDLVAQLHADYGHRPMYLGVETFIEMSRGLPRNLLVILKHVFQWAAFNGETPFRDRPVTRRSQQQGVQEAAQWFFRDAEVLGEHGNDVQNAIRRLADLFRAIRFSDKPAECSLCAFSTNLASMSAAGKRTLDLAERWSLLIRITRDQRDRNTGRVDAKFQLNSMLAPIWDLPIARRGVIALTADEADAIFDPDKQRTFEGLKRVRVGRMTAPRFSEEPADVHASEQRLPLFAPE